MIGKKKAGAAPIVVALSTGILKVKGVPYNFRQGERMRSNHPLVQRYGHLFCEDGLTDEEFAAARQAMLTAQEAAA
jgi:hypothetical protein